jgi:hypothetical protein
LFEFPRNSVSSSDFIDFLQFVRSRDCVNIPRDRVLSFISISDQLGNDRLSLALLSSLKPDSSKLLSFDFAETDQCASKFYSYSIDELRFLDHETLHRLLSSDCLVLESEESLLQLLLDLAVNRSEFLQYIEISLLSEEGLTLFLSAVSFDDLSEGLWLKVISRLKADSSDEPRVHRYRRRVDSTILLEIPPCLGDFQKKRWTLLYRGSRDGFAASAFHQNCNERSNTIAVIETTKGWVFGGFTPVAWDSSGGHKDDSSRKSFLFTVKNPRGSDGRKFMMASSAYAIACVGSYGPTFGNGYDLHIADACNQNTNCYTNFGNAFMNDSGINGQQVFVGEYTFTVKEIEVFAVGA